MRLHQQLVFALDERGRFAGPRVQRLRGRGPGPAPLDLAYAPPFSPVWDPVLVAARKAAEAVLSAG